MAGTSSRPDSPGPGDAAGFDRLDGERVGERSLPPE